MKSKIFARRMLFTFTAFISLCGVTASNANAQRIATIQLDQATQNVELSDQITHTIYEDRLVRRTCYRDEIVGYERICENRPPVCTVEQVCRDIPYRYCEGNGSDQKCETRYRHECRNVNRCVPQPPSCYNRPIYRRRAYDCSYYQQVPVGTEIDYQIESDITVRMNNTTGISASTEALRLVLNQSQLSVNSTQSSGELMLVARKDIRTTTVREDEGPDRPGLIRVDGTIDIEAIRKSDAIALLVGGVRDLSLTQHLLTAMLGRNTLSELVMPSLKITRHHPLWPDKRLINRKLTSSEFLMVDLGDKTEIRIDLDHLLIGNEIESGKTHQAELEIALESRGGFEILNESALGKLKASGKVRVKIP